MYRMLAVGTMLAAGVVFALAPLALTQERPGAQPGGNQTGKQLDDRTFVMKAAQGGMAEVALGRLAEKNASSEKVRQFGMRMVKDHGMANKELIVICEKNNFEFPKRMGKEHKECWDKLSGLKGQQFDRAYMKEMVKDHKEDVEEFMAAAQGLQNQDLRRFAAKTLPILREHLKMAEDIHRTLGSGAGNSGQGGAK